ncbi:hypothetical protein DFR70_10672 [Nocardia tenerifensis]|uniref:Uncharacterized protein n=1 Tax=Nocardia tenerifensis TaxID=228006 RepID=A0A318JZT2_9NOCA|nr:hypothetical protein [Nocardia tenerifensis]PXX63018.1 hypothetical protein DFR70_10672 [Nocardia tenerifensis]
MNVSRGLLDGMDTAGLNVALSEATCLGLEVDAAAKQLRLDLEVLTLPENGTPTEDYRVQVIFTGVGRVAASLRMQNWDDLEPQVLPLQLDGLDQAIRSFGGGRLHGWEFVDLDDSGWALWSELLSFDTTIDDHISAHVLEFSQEEGIDPRELDVRVWFDNVIVNDSTGREIPVKEFIAGAARWWEAHDAGDPRATRPGVAPPL